MKRFSAVFLSIFMLAAFTGCSDNRFMRDNEIKAVSENPTGLITLSYKISSNDADTRSFNLEFTLYYDKAPITVTNFIKLANSGFYNGTFVNSFSIAEDGGYLNIEAYEYGKDNIDTDYDESLDKVPKKVDYKIKGEFSENGWAKNDVKHVAGILSMIRSEEYDTASSKFMVCLDTLASRDGLYAAFGKIDTAIPSTLMNDLIGLNSNGIIPDSCDFKIVSVTVDTKGIDFGEPLKLKA